MPVLELLGRVAQPALENPRLFQATDRALRAMDAADEAHVLAVAAASLLKTLAFSGLRPSLEVCVSCGEPVALEDGARLPFSAIEGGVACPACRPSLETESVDAATLCWAQYFIASTFDAIAAGPADVSASFAVLHLVQSLVRAHVGAPLKSLEFLFTSGLF
jgi:DNA repair protein RecO (recombination protein O)